MKEETYTVVWRVPYPSIPRMNSKVLVSSKTGHMESHVYQGLDLLTADWKHMYEQPFLWSYISTPEACLQRARDLAAKAADAKAEKEAALNKLTAREIEILGVS
jgi:hypothetical protein